MDCIAYRAPVRLLCLHHVLALIMTTSSAYLPCDGEVQAGSGHGRVRLLPDAVPSDGANRFFAPRSRAGSAHSIRARPADEERICAPGGQCGSTKLERLIDERRVQFGIVVFPVRSVVKFRNQRCVLVNAGFCVFRRTS